MLLLLLLVLVVLLQTQPGLVGASGVAVVVVVVQRKVPGRLVVCWAGMLLRLLVGVRAGVGWGRS
jgi:hypothetical protein